MQDYRSVLQDKFPKNVIDQSIAAARIKTSSLLPFRLDLRGKTVFSFAESADSHCQTAFSLYKNDFGWQLGVHIADVCEYVCDGSPLDIEARRRCATISDGITRSEMLPDALVSGICDLTSGGDKATLSILLDISPDGKLLSTKFEESIIGPAEKCIYSEIEKVSLSRDTSAVMLLRKKYHHLNNSFWALYEMAAMFLAQRRDRETPEWCYCRRVYGRDQNGNIDSYAIEFEPDIHAAIREIGYFVSDAVGKYMMQNGLPCIYIGQEMVPDTVFDYLSNLLGHHCHESNPIKRASHITELAKGSPYYSFICCYLNSNLPCATFSDKPVANCLCGSDHIVSFFHPATAYTDLLTLRTLKNTIIAAGNPNNLNLNRHRKTVREFAEEATKSQRYVFEATRHFELSGAFDLITSKPNQILKGYPLKKEENGDISIFLECGYPAVITADNAKNIDLESCKLSEFIVLECLPEAPAIVKPV